MRKALFLLGIFVFSIGAFAQDATQGSLYAVSKKGQELGSCPLKDTAVKTDISGFLARVRVVQEFENSFTEPIEAVYAFPLSQNGAVDDMTMTIGDRIVRGKIMKREEARAVYESAKTAGQTASLLDQERPNIFTQAVANIMPGEKVTIEISYVETLKYEDGAYEFVFPMTVGPRYIPLGVTDAAKIKPPIAATRAGHDISMEVNLNAGVPVEEIRSTSHQIDQVNLAPNAAKITLRDEKTIPNKDFILRYDVTGKRIEDAILTHRNARGGFFTFVLQPPDKIASEDRTPKEIVFVLDTSGSMSGFPIEKAKEAMKLSLEGLYPEDTFNLITFAGDTSILFEQPVPATQANLEKAQAFLDSRQGGGGTEMMKAIKASLDPSDSNTHLRIVCFMTDGYVGNESEIVAEIQRHPKARVFSFGIGSSVNRFLLDKMAEAGNGEVEYVSLTDDGSKAAKKFYERVRTPLLTDLSIDWNGMPVADIYPSKLSDLFSAKPVILNGRYSKAANGTIKLKGKVAGQEYERAITVNLPETEMANDVLATLWARRRVDELSNEIFKATGSTKIDDLNREITGLGLEFRMLTQFTSFVAVEDRIVNRNGAPVKIEVPVAIPEGVDRAMATGGLNEVVEVSAGQSMVNVSSSQVSSLPINGRSPKRSIMKRKMSGQGTGGGQGSGSGSGAGYGTAALMNSPAGVTGLRLNPGVISSGVINGQATNLPKPAYPPAAKAVNASGAVSVQITIDESGNVISATPVSGHPLLRAAAVQAANGAKFTPTMLSGQPVKVTGVVTYNFVDPSKAANVTVGVGTLAPQSAETAIERPPLSPEQVREMKLKEKFHAWVYAVVERVRNNTSPTPNESSFVRDGKAEIQIVLTSKSVELIERLKSMGFDLAAEKGMVLTGRITIEKLVSLAEIDEVRFVLPKI